MKKLLAILLTLCMLVGMAGIAEGGKVTAQVTYMGNSLADVIATWNTDEEGCAQFGVNGKVMGTVLDVLAQVGANSIVIASGEQAYEITAENLGKALYNTGAKYIGEENMQKIFAVVQYVSEGTYKEDMAILSRLAQNELGKLMQLAVEEGVFYQTESGIQIRIDEKNLPALIKDYLASVANDGNLFAALSTTKFWSLMGLSEGGVSEQAMIAQLVTAIPDDLGVDFDLYIDYKFDSTFNGYLTVEVEGKSISYSVDFDGTRIYAYGYAKQDGQELAYSSIDAKLDGRFDYSFTANVEGVHIDFYADFDGEKLSAYGKATQNDQELASFRLAVKEDGSVGIEIKTPALYYYYTAEVDGTKVSVDYELKQITNGYLSQDVDVSVEMDSAAYTAEFDVEVTEENVLTNAKNSEINVSGDVNLMSAEWLDATMTVKNRASDIEMHITGTTEQTEEGTVLKAKFDVRDGENWHEDALNVTVTVGSVVKLHSHLNNWNSTGEFAVYTLDAALDLMTWKIDGALVYGGVTYVLAGSLDEDGVYRAAITVNGAELAHASLAIDTQKGLLYSLLMGDLWAELHDGSYISRKAELTETSGQWTIDLFDGAKLTTYVVGLRQITDEEGQAGFEAFANAGGVEYVAGFKYLVNGATYKGEAYLSQKMGSFAADIFKLKLGYEPISTPAAHITGTELPAEAIEQMLEQLIQNVMQKVSK